MTYKNLGAKILPEAWKLLNHEDWKIVKQSNEDDIVSSLMFQNRKIYKLTVSLHNN